MLLRNASPRLSNHEAIKLQVSSRSNSRAGVEL